MRVAPTRETDACGTENGGLTDELEQNDAVGGTVVLECIEHGKLRNAWSPNSDTALDHTPRSAPGKPGPQVQHTARRM